MIYFLLPLAAYAAYPASPATCRQYSGAWESNGSAWIVTTDRCVVSLGDDGMSPVFVSSADGSGGKGFTIDWAYRPTPLIPNDGYTAHRPAAGVSGCIVSLLRGQPWYWRRCPVPAADPNLDWFSAMGSGLGPTNNCADASGDYLDNYGDLVTLIQKEGTQAQRRCYNDASSDGAYIIKTYSDGGACTDCFRRGDEGLCSIAANKDITCADGYTLTYQGPAGSTNNATPAPSPAQTPGPIAPACSDYDKDKKGCKKAAAPLSCKFKTLKAGKPGYVVGGPKRQSVCIDAPAPTCADQTKDSKCLSNRAGLSCCWDSAIGACKAAGSCAVATCAGLTSKKLCLKHPTLSCSYNKKAGTCSPKAAAVPNDPCLRHTIRGPCNKDTINNCVFIKKTGGCASASG